MPLTQRACVVCGAGSTRESWSKSRVIAGTMYVACDGHSPAEFEAALPKTAAPAPPNGGTKPAA